MNTKPHLVAQYSSADKLQTRIETHRAYTHGANLEEIVDAALGVGTSTDLLDIGTGTGDFPARLRAAGLCQRLVGLDASPAMIAHAKTQHAASIEYLLGDAQALPFPDHSFDAVSARHMLYHLPNIPQAILEAKRVLRPQGRFLALTNADGYMQEFWDAARQATQDQTELAAFVVDMTAAKYFHGALHAQIQTVFPNAELRLLQQALHFPNPESALRYWDTLRTTQHDHVWNAGRAALQDTLEDVFSRDKGWSNLRPSVWKVQKNLAVIVANT